MHIYLHIYTDTHTHTRFGKQHHNASLVLCICPVCQNIQSSKRSLLLKPIIWISRAAYSDNSPNKLGHN